MNLQFVLRLPIILTQTTMHFKDLYIADAANHLCISNFDYYRCASFEEVDVIVCDNRSTYRGTSWVAARLGNGARWTSGLCRE